MEKPQKNLVILFADIANSTQFYQVEGDIEAHRRIAQSLGYMAKAVQDNGGEVLRTVGDSTLASFDHCDQALAAACAMQEMHKLTPLRIRAGFHFGSVIPDKGDVYGNAVNIAARVAGYARASEIVATEQCVAELSQDLQSRVELLDHVSVKGIAEPVAIFRIDWDTYDEQQTRIAQMQTLVPADQCELLFEFANKPYRIGETDGSYSIGRGQDCSLAIEGDRVSRLHANIRCVQGQVLLSDESTNGTYLHRDGHSALFVRRESVVVEGSGSIGFGCLPSDDTALAVYFTVQTVNSE